MFLSRIELDTKRRSTMKALTSPNILHGAIEQSYSGPRERRLWRLDQLQHHLYLLLLSPNKPDLTNIVNQFGFPDRNPRWETRSYGLLLDSVKDATRWRFRLVANPIKCCKPSQDDKNRGQIHAHITSAHQSEWLLQRCQNYGFSLNPDQFLVVGSQWYRFHKGNQRKSPVTILAVTYEGILTITNAVRFQQTLQEGLGRGKAFGMGMLTIIRDKGAENE